MAASLDYTQGWLGMAQEQALQFLQQGIAASRSGNPDQARELFQQAVRLDPQNETIWLWLASVARDDKERFFCLKQLLTINPQNEFALKGMQALGVKAAPETVQAAPSTSVPVLSDEKYSRLQQMLDDFLRHYSPQPVDRLMIQWGHKPKGRYSEGGGKRLQRTFYVAAALVTLVVVAGIALIAVGAGSMLGGESTKVAVHSTRAATSTATPTLTPTLGGASPTPFPNPMAIPPTEIPSGLTQGSVYEAAEPTAIYPPVDPSVAGAISDAVDDYSIGEYAQAAEALETERKSSRPQCYAAVVYYEAMSYAGLGGAQNLNKASQVLEEDLAYQPSDPRYSSCQNAPLVLAGLGYVRYLQNRIDEALTLSQRALADDPKLVEASITKARIELAGRY
jgi:tetratricopeptide (TPR) repeat protein